jgi:hypothetical protein
MRIFSIHKSKSKKQVSEKTPKLAANKFLEKRKVGSVIYLHEHPSGKIHGPYRKEYDKKIMKGGAWSFGSLSKSEFKVRIPLGGITPEVLYGTNQLIIKQTRRDIFEPHIFFGPKDFKIDGNNYYTYAVFNTYLHPVSLRENQFIKGMITCQKITDNDIASETMTKIEAPILLGFYTQYIDICKRDFPEDTRPIENIDSLHMARLFFYLFYNILPIIAGYILEQYITPKSQSSNFRNVNIQTLIQQYPEIGYFMNILSFIKRIDFDRLLDNVLYKFDITYGTDSQRLMKERIKKQIKQRIEESKKFNSLTPQQQVDELRRSIHEIQVPSSGLAHGMAMTGTNPTDVFDIIMGIIGFFCGGR